LFSVIKEHWFMIDCCLTSNEYFLQLYMHSLCDIHVSGMKYCSAVMGPWRGTIDESFDSHKQQVQGPITIIAGNDQNP
jgi:hypothetical protein